MRGHAFRSRADGIHAAGFGDRRNLPAGEFDVEGPPRDFRRRGLSALECDASTMIQLKTMLNCIDNSGAAVVECVNVLKKQRPATVGDRIVVVVQKQRNFGPESSTSTGIANKVRRGDIRHAVVVRAAKEMQRPDGSIVKFDDNACVLVNKTGDPIGTRMNGVVATELRGKQWSKILSLAPLHV